MLNTFLTALAWIACSQVGPPGEQQPVGDARPILSVMAGRGASFNPERLHRLGTPGLKAALDWLWPDTAESPAVDGSLVEMLIAQLASEKFQLREQATAKLTALGPGGRPYLLEAANSNDAEVRQRAARILKGWEPLAEAELARYAAAFEVYAAGITDEERLDLIAERTAAALWAGMPEGARLESLRSRLRAFGAAGQDRYCDVLVPLLQHQDVRVPVLIVEEIGGARPKRFFPLLLVEALRSDREEVVHGALAWSPNCWHESRAAEVKRLLRRHFEGSSDRLKFAASFPLMHDYGDPDAIGHLLSETQSSDAERARTAIVWLGDTCNFRKPASRGLLASLAPFLRAQHPLRREAASALGTYSGENVIRTLLPMLGDPEAMIVKETSRNLLDQPDTGLLRQVLEEAAENHRSAAVRKNAAKLLLKVP